MDLYWPFLLAEYFSVLEAWAIAVAIVIFISSIDDLFIDVIYWSQRVLRRLKGESGFRALSEQDLRRQAEQPLAIMIPAWHEHDVIAQMAESLVSTIDYDNYVIFVGTYVNDPDTIREVERMRVRYRHLIRVEVPHPGPTCKADCLNWVVQAIFLYEEQHDIEFAGVLLHDSEDVVHPIELKFFNYLLPAYDLVQVPVVSLEREWFELVGGTYMDEFAEWHAKDLPVRQSLTGMVPSAGVGTCFSRRALGVLARENENQPFNTSSLTEDYDIGTRFLHLGMNSTFARYPVTYKVERKRMFGFLPPKLKTIRMPLCVQEFFPDTFATSYRQKARWTLGIGLQAWQHFGWPGGIGEKYILFRDRKGLITSFAAVFAYLLVFQVLVFYLAGVLGFWTVQFPASFDRDGWVGMLLLANGLLLTLRLTQRMYFVNRLHGWEHALLSAPRMVVGNFVNCAAAARAWRIFLSSALFAKPIVWDKTQHDFPSASGLRHRPERFADVLIAWKAANADEIEQGLATERHTGQPLTRILATQGAIDDETIAEAVSYQSDLPRTSLDGPALKANENLLSQELCIRHSVLPAGLADDDRLIVAASAPLDEATVTDLEQASGRQIVQQIARESEVLAGLRFLRGDEGAFREAGRIGTLPLLGDILLEHDLVAPEAFRQALARYTPATDGRIGEYLVRAGVVSEDAVREALRLQQVIRNDRSEE